MSFTAALLLPPAANTFNRVDHVFYFGSIQLPLGMDRLIARVPDFPQHDFLFQRDAVILRQEV